MRVTKTLDVGSLSTGWLIEYDGPRNRVTLDFEELFNEKLRPVITSMMPSSLIRDTASLGFALAHSRHVLRNSVWVSDEPEMLVKMTAGWGPEKNRYIANAVRKLRFSARTHHDSIDALQFPDLIDTPVDSVDERGDFPWGDFPYGGAVWVTPFIPGELQMLGAVSGLSQEEDHMVATLILQIFALEIKKLQTPAEA